MGVCFIWARNKIDGSERGVLISTRFFWIAIVSLDENREEPIGRKFARADIICITSTRRNGLISSGRAISRTTKRCARASTWIGGTPDPPTRPEKSFRVMDRADTRNLDSRNSQRGISKFDTAQLERFIEFTGN